MDRQDQSVPAAAVQETSFTTEDTNGNESAGQTSSAIRDVESSAHGQHEQLSPVNGQSHHNGNHYGSTPINGLPSSPKLSSSAAIGPLPARAVAPDLLRGLLMALMALDHTVVGLLPWGHGQSIVEEMDGVVVREWNRPLGYAVRIFTHLCAPGFTFLLGMGVAYFARSRGARGWGSARMAQHFFVRAVVLTAVMEVIGLVLTVGRTWFLNMVLFMMAVDYLLSGLLWLAVGTSERLLACQLLRVLPDRPEDDQREPLLQSRVGAEDAAADRKIVRAADVAWHVHNALLLALAVVTIWWNIWLSPDSGHCTIEQSAQVSAIIPPRRPTDGNPFFRIWFWSVETPHVISGFPPMAWLSFAILGLLYGRIILARPWKVSIQILGNVVAGLAFFVIFVLTRVLRFGNLSEDCLQISQGAALSNSNQYLKSASAFFYIVKYPPDVAFWAYTMAVNLLLLAFFGAIPSRIVSRFLKPLTAYGTSPLFFYVVHIILLFTLARIIVTLFGHDVDQPDPLTGEPGRAITAPWAVFGTWLLGLAGMYPLCRWYGAFKSRKGPDSVWRFF